MDSITGSELAGAAEPDDPGLVGVAALLRRLQVDPEWYAPLSRGFSWWGAGCRQDITADPVSFDAEMGHIVIRTHLGSGLVVRSPRLDQLLAVANAGHLGGALRALSDGRVVAEAAFTFEGDPDDEIIYLATLAATLMLADGPEAVRPVLDALGGMPEVSAHPTSGLRPAPDEMLLLPALIAPVERRLEIDEGPNPWALQTTWEDAARFATSNGIGPATTGPRKLTAQFPLRDLPLRWSPVDIVTGRIPTALLLAEWTSLERLGPGVNFRLLLPETAPAGDLVGRAALLNAAEVDRAMESGPGPMHFGAWAVLDVMGQPSLGYQSFVPATSGRRMALTNLIAHMAVRTKKATRWLEDTNHA